MKWMELARFCLALRAELIIFSNNKIFLSGVVKLEAEFDRGLLPTLFLFERLWVLPGVEFPS